MLCFRPSGDTQCECGILGDIVMQSALWLHHLVYRRIVLFICCYKTIEFNLNFWSYYLCNSFDAGFDTHCSFILKINPHISIVPGPCSVKSSRKYRCVHSIWTRSYTFLVRSFGGASDLGFVTSLAWPWYMWPLSFQLNYLHISSWTPAVLLRVTHL